MSFLSELKKQKQKLKCTETVVTTADGRRYVEGDQAVILESAFGFVVDTKPDDIPVLITKHLYIGSQDCAADKVCNEYNIKHILSLGVHTPVSNVNQKFVQMLDLPETDIKPLLSECLRFIRTGIERTESVLVHCNAGVSRAATVGIAYLMHYERMNFEDAYHLVKTKRPAIRPNDGFREQLKRMRPGEVI